MSTITLYSIGDFAKLKGTTIETLRHYDRTDLLKPECIDENSSYRYYSFKQILRYDMIMCCKSIGMSLQEIQEVFKQNDSALFMNLIAKHRNLTLDKIAQLNKSIETMDILHMQMEHSLSLPKDDACYIRVLPKRTYFHIECEESLPREQLELVFTNLINQITKQYGTTMYAGGFTYDMQEKPTIHCELFECVVEDVHTFSKDANISVFPAGRYLCKKHNHEYLRDDLKQFMTEMAHYHISGDQIIDSYLIDGRFLSHEREFELQAFLDC